MSAAAKRIRDLVEIDSDREAPRQGDSVQIRVIRCCATDQLFFSKFIMCLLTHHFSATLRGRESLFAKQASQISPRVSAWKGGLFGVGKGTYI
mgnify:FL=1